LFPHSVNETSSIYITTRQSAQWEPSCSTRSDKWTECCVSQLCERT
jgi:hypothetical protein